MAIVQTSGIIKMCQIYIAGEKNETKPILYDRFVPNLHKNEYYLPLFFPIQTGKHWDL